MYSIEFLQNNFMCKPQYRRTGKTTDAIFFIAHMLDILPEDSEWCIYLPLLHYLDFWRDELIKVLEFLDIDYHVVSRHNIKFINSYGKIINIILKTHSTLDHSGRSSYMNYIVVDRYYKNFGFQDDLEIYSRQFEDLYC